MRTEIPEFKRCCFCLPLRYGLLSWGVIKLVSSLLAMALTIANIVYYETHLKQYARSSIKFPILVSIQFIMISMDLVMSTILAIASHKKIIKLLRVYYIYCLVSLGLNTTLFIFVVGYFIYLTVVSHFFILVFFVYQFVCASAFVIVFIVLQGYIAMLVRSEIIKLENTTNFRFVNNVPEPHVYQDKGDFEEASMEVETGVSPGLLAGG